MSLYAKETNVSVEKSRSEIESILTRYGATHFAYATRSDKALIEFRLMDRRVRFVLRLPDKTDPLYTNRTWGGKIREGQKLHPDEAYRLWEKACRQKWRCLALSIKGRLESAASEIDTFEEAFMSHIVMPDGQTLSEHVSPMIDKAYKSGKVPALLPYFE